MPTWLTVVLLVAVAIVVLLAAGGAVARARMNRAGEQQFARRLERANNQLAAAAAEDRGWARERIESAARAAFGEEATAVHLVGVVDRPGTDQDQALVVVEGLSGDRREITLNRRGDGWFAA